MCDIHYRKNNNLVIFKVKFSISLKCCWVSKTKTLTQNDILVHNKHLNNDRFRGGSRTAATSKMEHFVIIVNGWKTLTIITKRSILDVATVLDPPLRLLFEVNLMFKISNKKLHEMNMFKVSDGNHRRTSIKDLVVKLGENRNEKNQPFTKKNPLKTVLRKSCCKHFGKRNQEGLEIRPF